jgi:hypothetical protein
MITRCCSRALREAVIMAHVCRMVPTLLPQNMISRPAAHRKSKLTTPITHA